MRLCEEWALDFREQRAPTVDVGLTNEVRQLPSLALPIVHQEMDLNATVGWRQATHNDPAARFVAERADANALIVHPRFQTLLRKRLRDDVSVAIKEVRGDGTGKRMA